MFQTHVWIYFIYNQRTAVWQYQILPFCGTQSCSLGDMLFFPDRRHGDMAVLNPICNAVVLVDIIFPTNNKCSTKMNTIYLGIAFGYIPLVTSHGLCMHCFHNVLCDLFHEMYFQILSSVEPNSTSIWWNITITRQGPAVKDVQWIIKCWGVHYWNK